VLCGSGAIAAVIIGRADVACWQICITLLSARKRYDAGLQPVWFGIGLALVARCFCIHSAAAFGECAAGRIDVRNEGAAEAAGVLAGPAGDFLGGFFGG